MSNSPPTSQTDNRGLAHDDQMTQCANKCTNRNANRFPVGISVIIPTLNEAATIAGTLKHLHRAAIDHSLSESSPVALEIIVVDGGSQDTTPAIVTSLGGLFSPGMSLQLMSSDPGRAQQMNAGAAKANGSVLVFLHADTHLPPGFPALIHQALVQDGVVAGAFALAIADDHPSLRWVERGVNWRSQVWQLPYGDQALFLRRETFQRLGGFPQQPIMEDYALVRQLQRQGTIALVPQPVLTSARRWQTLGIVKTTLINQLILLGYHLGISPHTLAGWYRRKTG